MPNGTYGGVRGKETKVGQKTFVSRPTRFINFVFLLGGRFEFALPPSFLPCKNKCYYADLQHFRLNIH